MQFKLEIPTIKGTSLNLEISLGETIFVLGANGTVKSGLINRIFSENSERAYSIYAHRQNWFPPGATAISAQQKIDLENSIKSGDTSPDARWNDGQAVQRPRVAIYNLIDSENTRSRKIAKAVDQKDIDLAKKLSQEEAPIKVINELLRLANIQISIDVREDQEIIATKPGFEPYGISRLSDGERSALLIAANVLTIKTNTLIIIDEPERHLHRSIISPLLTQLFAKRPDCSFIISTHDITLPLDNPSAQTLLVSGCTYTGNIFKSWDIDVIPANTEITDSLKRDIFGARRKLIFVEGTENSLDKPLYSLIFPNIAVIAKSSCHDVERAVKGIRLADKFH